MSLREFFKPSFAKVLWFLGFFVISFEALWIQILCIGGSCNSWFSRLLFWVFAWPCAFRGIFNLSSNIQIFIAAIFFIVIPFIYYYILASIIVNVFPVKRKKQVAKPEISE